MPTYLFILCLLLSFSITNATSLFDPKRGTPPAVAVSAPAVNVKAKPIFYKLIGITKFGKKYNITFEDTRNKQAKVINWQADDNNIDSPITGFYIDHVHNRKIVMKANEENRFACAENKLNNVYCNNEKKEMTFQLTTLAPSKVLKPVVRKTPVPRKPVATRPKTAPVPTNRFSNPFKIN